MLINHWVRKQNLPLAMIEGTEIKTMCGETFVPEVIVGTSGKAHQPGAPLCSRCEGLFDIAKRWSRLKDERDRIEREMAELDAQWRKARRSKPEPALAVAS
jgi:hypothetical protein